MSGAAVLYLVRHGQASFGQADYDRLSALGERQCELLGRHWAGQGIGLAHVCAGRLRRHQQSAAAFLRARAAAGCSDPPLETLAELAEYPYEVLLRAHAATAEPRPDVRAWFADPRVFDAALAATLERWLAGELAGPETWADFRAGARMLVDGLLARARAGASTVVFGSAGSLSAGLQQHLGLDDRALMRFKLALRNSAVTVLVPDGTGARVAAANDILHLDAAGDPALVTLR